MSGYFDRVVQLVALAGFTICVVVMIVIQGSLSPGILERLGVVWLSGFAVWLAAFSDPWQSVVLALEDDAISCGSVTHRAPDRDVRVRVRKWRLGFVVVELLNATPQPWVVLTTRADPSSVVARMQAHLERMASTKE